MIDRLARDGDSIITFKSSLLTEPLLFRKASTLESTPIKVAFVLILDRPLVMDAALFRELSYLSVKEPLSGSTRDRRHQNVISIEDLLILQEVWRWYSLKPMLTPLLQTSVSAEILFGSKSSVHQYEAEIVCSAATGQCGIRVV